jgi:uncharacterized membrane protein YczE
LTLICRKTDPEIIQLEYGSNFELQITLEKLGISPIESVEVVLSIPYAVPKGDEFLTFHSFMVKLFTLIKNKPVQAQQKSS